MRPALSCFLALLGSAVACARPVPPPTLSPEPVFIGSEFVGRLAGVSTRESHLLASPTGRVYMLQLIDVEAGRFVLISRHAGRTAGDSTFRVFSAHRVGSLGDVEWVILGVCAQHGRPDASLVAIGSITSHSEYRRLRAAWRFDLQSETLQPIPHEGVTCGIRSAPRHSGRRASA